MPTTLTDSCCSSVQQSEVEYDVIPCRCNNVLYMRGVPETDEDGEARQMET